MGIPGQTRRDITDEVFARAVEQAKQTKPLSWKVEASRILGIVPSAVRQRLEKRPELNHAPVFPHPAGQAVKGVSTLYDADGVIKAQWVKSDATKRTPDEWAQHVRDALADVSPLKPIPAKRGSNGDLLTVYPIGDHHTAMYAWAEEAGADYDLKIAERLLVSAATHLVAQAPASKHALVINVGDFLHVDNLRNETSRSGNALDVDTRYAAMIRAAVKMLRAVIEQALTRHQFVTVVNAVGNHDDVGALWLSLALGQFYERNPRVTVVQQPGKFYYYRHGKVLIGVTHGDTVKLDHLGGVMAADRPEDWGATQHRYWITGHIHQRRTIELPGVMVESFRTLAARDAWASAAGYRSGRDMMNVVFHANHGEVARNRFDVSMCDA